MVCLKKALSEHYCVNKIFIDYSINDNLFKLEGIDGTILPISLEEAREIADIKEDKEVKFEYKTVNAPTNPEQIIGERAIHQMTKETVFDKISKAFKVPKKLLYPNKESENMREEKWTLYEVVMVDKEELKIEVREMVIAKNPEHAKGKAGVIDKLEEKEFDNTKFDITIGKISDIRPVKEDE